MKKNLIGIVTVIVIIVFLFLAARNILARTIVAKGVKAVTGMAVDIKSINIGLFRPGISVTGLKVYNPQGFSDKLLAHIPEVYVDFDLAGLLRNRVHLRQLKIDISELNVILSESRKLNVNSLALFLPKPGVGKAPQVQIDELWLKVGKVTYKAYLPAVGVKSKEFNMALDEKFHDVTNPSKVAADVLKRVLAHLGIANLANFDIKAQATQIKEQAQQAVGGVLQGTKDDLKSIFQSN